MLDQVLKTFEIVPDYDLAIMKKSQTLFDITGEILSRIKKVLEAGKPGCCTCSWRYIYNLCDSIGLFLYADTSRACGGWASYI